MKWSIEVILLIAAKEFFNNFSSVKHNRSNVLLSLNIQSVFTSAPRHFIKFYYSELYKEYLTFSFKQSLSEKFTVLNFIKISKTTNY
ncbi:hypothetical protein FWJ33_00200 [Leptospira interrogans serovar Hardjo]|nr:hypothetical protein B0191_19200 [Leptospira interrogans serovar Hardjo]QEH98020.1 hypothetical protein FWJ33_00200 [Leptospira interrogans serovar Hardjo]